MIAQIRNRKQISFIFCPGPKQNTQQNTKNIGKEVSSVVPFQFNAEFTIINRNRIVGNHKW